MKRRVVITTCLLAVVGGGAGAALAAPVQTTNHDVCIVFANNEDYHNTQYICVSAPTP